MDKIARKINNYINLRFSIIITDKMANIWRRTGNKKYTG